MFTTEQRDWMTEFMAKAPASLPPEEKDRSPAPNGRNGTDGTGIDEIDILIEQALDGDDSDRTEGGHDLAIGGGLTAMTCTGSIQNATAELLTVVSDSLDIDDGNLTTLPDAEIEPGKSVHFAAENTKVPIPIPLLGEISPFGIEGHIKYLFPDGETSVTLHFDNPRFEKWGKVTAEAILAGPRAAEFKATGTTGGGNKAVFKFKVSGPGGGDQPVPPGPDKPAAQATNCLITVVNQTGQTLLLDDQQNELGDFMTNPASTLAPGASTQFAYVGTPHGAKPGCRGFCRYVIGAPAVGVWRFDWNNPVADKNTATGQADATGAEAFRSLEQIGQGDENVPVTFTLFGGPPGGGTQPVPPVPVPPQPQPGPAFAPPPKSKQPTLRQGDTSGDGWVEYLQTALMTHGAALTVDGKFGPGTHKAVLAFQTKMKLKVDGIVGNQTWAALRDGTPQAPSTDGRAPHSFKEEGQEARFYTERDPAFYNQGLDTLFLNIVSVGDATQLKGRTMTVMLTPPGGKPVTLKAPIGDGIALGATDQGSLFSGEIAGMTKTYPSTPPGAPGNLYAVDAYLDQDLGGDRWAGKPAM